MASLRRPLAACALALVVLAWVHPADTQNEPVDPVGARALMELDRLPDLRRHTTVHQFGSYDPTGGNDDGFYTVNFLYHDASRQEFVLVDEQGPGCIYRIQMSDLTTIYGPVPRIRIYVDGATTPQVDLDLNAFFSGQHRPFIPPLVGKTHASPAPGFGYYCYTPIPYSSGVRVALTGIIPFYNITLHRYRPGIGPVPSFPNDVEIGGAASIWSRPPNRPTTVRATEQAVLTTLQIGSTASATALDVPGPGRIAAIELTPPANVDLRDLRLLAWWDNETTPSIDAPLGLFFGVGDRASPTAGLLIGARGPTLYCYFPMPFWQRARIAIANDGATPVTVGARVVHRPVPTTAKGPGVLGYFRAAYRAADPVAPGRDYTALDVGGRGHVVGIALDVAGRDTFNFDTFLEGDERVYIDHARTPAIHGNGTEDCFNGAYYFFGQTFSRPMHGGTFRDVAPQRSRRVVYRLLVGDTWPFESHIRVGFEVGGVGHVYGRYRSVVHYYHQPTVGIATTDRFDVGDFTDEAAHAFASDGGRTGTVTGAYVGDLDDEPVLDSGVALLPKRFQQFDLTIDPLNDGVTLWRRLDHDNNGHANQVARVEVGGQFVGTWRTPGRYLGHLPWFPTRPARRGQGTPDKRWRDVAFEIPKSFTTGKSRIRVKITNTGASLWNAYEYRCAVRRTTPAVDTNPPGAPTGVDARGLTDTRIAIEWQPAPDDVGVVAYEVWRSTPTAPVQTLVATVPGLRHVDWADPAVPSYDYRVRAIDAGGNVGPFSPVDSARAGNTIHFEFEQLLPASVTSPGDIAGQLDLILFTHFGRIWSGDNQVLFIGNAYGDRIGFVFPVSIARRYEPRIHYTSFTGTTSFEVRLDGQLLGTVHPPAGIGRRTATFPTRLVAAGPRVLEIRLVNGPSIVSGTQVVLDSFEFLPR